MSVTIILADDHKIMREGLRGILAQQRDFTVVAEADNGKTTVELALRLTPDVVIMDITMPDLNGIDATRRILATDPRIKVIALSVHSDKRFVTNMFAAGAAGYLRKDCAGEELILAIRTVLQRKTYVSPSLTGVVLPPGDDPVAQEGAPLTTKEREVVQLIAEGSSTKDIAQRLAISVKTVESHRKSIMLKLDIRSIAELTKFAIKEGLTDLER
jgi:DNA-binding NarL/FixJ family response regulator